jgi:hypothetical protein
MKCTILEKQSTTTIRMLLLPLHYAGFTKKSPDTSSQGLAGTESNLRAVLHMTIVSLADFS